MIYMINLKKIGKKYSLLKKIIYYLLINLIY